VAVVEYGLEILVGDGVQVTLDGQPEVTARLTVPLNPLPAVTVRVLEAVPPATILSEVGKALIAKSEGRGPEAALKAAMQPSYSLAPAKFA
jgi:hypothetical protein